MEMKQTLAGFSGFKKKKKRLAGSCRGDMLIQGDVFSRKEAKKKKIRSFLRSSDLHEKQNPTP